MVGKHKHDMGDPDVKNKWADKPGAPEPWNRPVGIRFHLGADPIDPDSDLGGRIKQTPTEQGRQSEPNQGRG